MPRLYRFLVVVLTIPMVLNLPGCGCDLCPVALPPLTTDVAQGHASDAQAVTVLTASTADAVTQTLEAIVGGTLRASGVSPGTVQALAAQALAAVDVPCPGGGTAAITVNGGTPEQQRNGRLDAGESYDIVFSACGSSTAGLVLDGRVAVAVTAYGDGAADLTTTCTALQATVAQGRYTIGGSLRQLRSTLVASEGSTTWSSRLTNVGVLDVRSAVEQRTASYTLSGAAWTVARTQGADGRLLGRSQQADLFLGVNVPRRPPAVLHVVTQGALGLGDDGLAASGSFSYTTPAGTGYSTETGADKVTVRYGTNTVDLALDLGSDGSVEQRWTLPRASFLREAG